MCNVKIFDIFSGILYPFCVRTCLKQFSGDDGNTKDYEDSLNKTSDPPCSRFIDAIVFNPEIFENSRAIVVSPANYSLPFETVKIHTKDSLTLMGFLILQQKIDYKNIPTIIFFHGNSGNIGDRLACAKKLFHQLKFNILLIEYRGYGFSQGYASERGIYLDSQAAFDFVDQRQDLDSTKIIIFGRSIGGAVVIDLASQRKYKNRIAAVIVENTFSSLPELARHILPKCFLPLIKLFRLSNKFQNFQKVSLIVGPTLFISSLNDKFIPPVHMTKLFMECKARRKQVIRFSQGEHLNAWTIKGYTKLVHEFVTESIKNCPVSNLLIVQKTGDDS